MRQTASTFLSVTSCYMTFPASSFRFFNTPLTLTLMRIQIGAQKAGGLFGPFPDILKGRNLG